MNRHQSINLRQLCLGYFLYSFCIKILSLPSILASGVGNLAWASALIGVIFEVGTVALITLILKYVNPTNKFFRIFCLILVPIIIGEVWLTCREIYHIAYTDLSTDLSLFIFILTIVLLGFFFITRQSRAVFRASEILWLLFALGLILAIVPTLYTLKVDWTQLINGNPSKLLPVTAQNLLFFESASFIFCFGSETKKSNRELGKINLTAGLCALGYVIMMVLLIILFGPLANQKNMAIVDFTTGAQFITSNGSLDWLIVVSVLAVLVLRFGMQLVAIVSLLKRGLQKNG